MSKIKDTYEIVSQTILNALEKGVVPWRCPWSRDNGMPRSLSTKKLYRGGNLMLLMVVALMDEYSSPWWGTYKQIAALGGQIRKGEKGTPVSYFKFIEKTDEDDPDGDPFVVPLHRYYTVFNIEQAEGIDVSKLPTVVEDFRSTLGGEFEANNHAEFVFKNYQEASALTLRFGGGRAFYSPSEDKVQMPPREDFYAVPEYYSTLFHEGVHSTGHETRLDRKEGMSNLFGDHLYSKEELVAEIGQAIILATLGIEYNVENTAAYIQSWSTALKDNPRWFASAGGQAQKAADYILKFTIPETE